MDSAVHWSRYSAIPAAVIRYLDEDSFLKPCFSHINLVVQLYWPKVVEDWKFVDERELEGWKGGVVGITCHHFTYGADRHCHTFVVRNIR